MASGSAHITPEHLNDIRTLDDVLAFFAEDLDWPITSADLEDASFDFQPEDLGIPAERVPRLRSIRQMRPLTTGQPWGIFFLEFEGPRLPVTPLRQLLRALVTRKRAGGAGERRTWALGDLLFIITTADHSGVELHLVAFESSDDASAQIFSLPWRPNQSPPQHLRRLAEELLPHLTWPDDPDDTDRWRGEWHAAFALRPGAAIKNAKALAERMASVAHNVRQRVDEILLDPDENEPLLALFDEIREQLIADLDHNRFADTCAQTLVYGLLSSRVTDPIGFGASPVLAVVPLANPFLDAFFERVHDRLHDPDGTDGGLAGLVADLRATDVEAIVDQFGSTARGGDPVIHFYEEFLKAYDPRIRAEAGAFYTPQPVVQYMVRCVDDALRTRLSLPGGVSDGSTWATVADRLGIDVPAFADPSEPFVRLLDPATGTGTFLVEWIRRARESFTDAGGAPADWPRHLAEIVLPSMTAFELMPGPYSIAHLKVAIEAHAEGVSEGSPMILLTDSLEHPDGTGSQVAFDPLQDPVAFEGALADAVKADPVFSVLIGNPPYRRLAKDEAGGWVVHGAYMGKRALFDDVVKAASESTIFSHVASLYNLYSYFWRWALWTAFERPGDAPGVVAFITASSWLDGPGFVGLRQIALAQCDEIFVVDLGGNAHDGVPDENVFDIQVPVAIVLLIRHRSTDITRPATVRYRRLVGTRSEKFAELSRSVHLDDEDWSSVDDPEQSMLALPESAAEWDSMPSLRDLFPWHQPGVMLNRTWPVAPDGGTLGRRWKSFLSDPSEERRADLFPDPKSGRRVTTQVAGMRRLVDLDPAEPHEELVPYYWRAFDSQLTFRDVRLTKTDSPSLWQTAGPRQIFVITPSAAVVPAEGPVLLISRHVPDRNAFYGHSGGTVIPAYRDRQALEPNAAPGLPAALQQVLGLPTEPTHDDLVAYTVALLGTPSYRARFSKELEGRALRVPITRSPNLWMRGVEIGERLIRLEGDVEHDERLRVAVMERIPSSLPKTVKDIAYDASSDRLTIADGYVTGVSPAVWGYAVGSWPVLKRWLEHRTFEGRGKRTSELNDIRPDQWDPAWTAELLDLIGVLHAMIELQPEVDVLLDAVLAGPLVAASDLPTTSPEERKPPDTIATRPEAGTLF